MGHRGHHYDRTGRIFHSCCVSCILLSTYVLHHLARSPVFCTIAIIMYYALSPESSPPLLVSEADASPPSLFSDIDKSTSPPPLPPNSVYTSCYCEENIYLLAQAFTQLSDADSTADDRARPWPWQIYVVFISNGGKTVRDSITFSPLHFEVATAAFISLAVWSYPSSLFIYEGLTYRLPLLASYRRRFFYCQFCEITHYSCSGNDRQLGESLACFRSIVHGWNGTYRRRISASFPHPGGDHYDPRGHIGLLIGQKPFFPPHSIDKLNLEREGCGSRLSFLKQLL